MHPSLNREEMGISASEPSHMQALRYLRLLLRMLSLWPCLAGKKSQPRLLEDGRVTPMSLFTAPSKKSVLHSCKERRFVSLAQAGWLGNWKSRGSPERLQECCRCGVSTKSVSPRLNRPSRPILPWAFEGYRLWNNLWRISTTTLALDLKHPETGGQRFPSVVHKQPAPTHSQESRGSDSSSAPNILTGEQSSSGGYLPFFAKLLLYSLGEDAQGFR